MNKERLNEVKILSTKMMKLHGIDDWSFIIEEKKCPMGHADYRNRLISLSKWHVVFSDMAEIRNTILHEIAHVLDYLSRGYSSHDKIWKKLFISIDGNGKRCGNISYDVEKKLKKWIYICPNCGRTDYEYKRWKEMGCYSCSAGFDDVDWYKNFALEWKLNPEYFLNDKHYTDMPITTEENVGWVEVFGLGKRQIPDIDPLLMQRLPNHLFLKLEGV